MSESALQVGVKRTREPTRRALESVGQSKRRKKSRPADKSNGNMADSVSPLSTLYKGEIIKLYSEGVTDPSAIAACICRAHKLNPAVFTKEMVRNKLNYEIIKGRLQKSAATKGKTRLATGCTLWLLMKYTP